MLVSVTGGGKIPRGFKEEKLKTPRSYMRPLMPLQSGKMDEADRQSEPKQPAAPQSFVARLLGC